MFRGLHFVFRRLRFVFRGLRFRLLGLSSRVLGSSFSCFGVFVFSTSITRSKSVFMRAIKRHEYSSF